MLGRCKQLMVSLLFRPAKHCVQLLPEWLLRFRPFGVYEIRLGEGWAEFRESLPETRSDSPVRIAWVKSREELPTLAGVAAPENLQAWNPVTRRLAVAWLNEKPIAAAWIAAESFAEPELGLSYQLPSDEVWLFAAVVQPEYRRQGIYGQLLRFVLDELAEENWSRMLLGISTGNEASLAAHKKFGAKQIGSIFAAKSLGFGFCRTSGDVQRSSRGIVWGREMELSITQS